MEDIGKELYEKVKANFDRRCAEHYLIQQIPKKIAKGTADMTDLSSYAGSLGAQLASAILDEVTQDVLPDGRLYYNIAKSIIEPMLKGNYDLINQTAAALQESIDSKMNFRIKSKQAPFPQERVDTAIGAASQEGIPWETTQRRMSSTPENITHSMADDYMKTNAELRSRAGIDTYIERRDDGKCCEWCSKLAGRYRYPEQVPRDVFRRHDNCGCLVSYVTPGGMRQNVHSKRDWSDEDQREYLKQLDEEKKRKREERKARWGDSYNLVKNEHIRFTPKEAAEREKIVKEKIAEKRKMALTKGGKGGIINTVNNTQDFMDREHRDTLSRKVNKNGKTVLEQWSIRSNPLGGYSNIFSETFSQNARAMAVYLDKTVNSGAFGTIDRIVIAKHSSLRGISTYDHVRNTLFISEELITKEGFERIVDTSYFPAKNLDDVVTHELDGHKRHWDMVKKFYNDNLDRYSSLEDAKQDYERSFRNYIVKQQSSDYFYVRKNISKNAFDGFDKSSSLNELLADCTVMYRNNQITDTELFDLVKELMKYDANAK